MSASTSARYHSPSLDLAIAKATARVACVSSVNSASIGNANGLCHRSTTRHRPPRAPRTLTNSVAPQETSRCPPSPASAAYAPRVRTTAPASASIVLSPPGQAPGLFPVRWAPHKRELTALSPCSTLSSCRLLLSVRACPGSTVQPGSHRGFLMPPTPSTTAEKAAQTEEARLETSLRPPALHLLP